MKKRIISILAIAAVLVASISVPCIADDVQTLPVSVEVSEYISITISDNGTAGINFSNLNPGTDNNTEEVSSESGPSLTITVDAGSNANVDLQISGTNFDDATFLIGNAMFATSWTGEQTRLTTDNTTFISDVAPGEYVNIWHWLDVPSGLASDTYYSQFTYKAIVYTEP